MNLPNPSKFKGLGHGALMVVGLIFDFIIYLTALNYLDDKKLSSEKYYLQFAVITIFFIALPIIFYFFLNKMDYNFTLRELFKASKNGQKLGAEDIDKLMKRGK